MEGSFLGTLLLTWHVDRTKHRRKGGGVVVNACCWMQAVNFYNVSSSIVATKCLKFHCKVRFDPDKSSRQENTRGTRIGYIRTHIQFPEHFFLKTLVPGQMFWTLEEMEKPWLISHLVLPALLERDAICIYNECICLSLPNGIALYDAMCLLF